MVNRPIINYEIPLQPNSKSTSGPCAKKNTTCVCGKQFMTRDGCRRHEKGCRIFERTQGLSYEETAITTDVTESTSRNDRSVPFNQGLDELLGESL